MEMVKKYAFYVNDDGAAHVLIKKILLFSPDRIHTMNASMSQMHTI